MGLFSLGKEIYAKGVTAVAKPITQTISKVTGIKATPTTSEQFLNTKIGSTLAGAATITAAVGLGAVAVKAVQATGGAASLVPTTLKGKAVATVATLATVGALAKEPKATLETPVKAAGAIANIGGNIAQFVVSPSVESAKDIITENPITAAVGGALGVAALGAGVLGATTSIANTLATKELTEAITAEKPLSDVPTGVYDVISQESPKILSKTPISTESAVGIDSLPITPQTTTITTGKRRYKRQGKKIIPSVRQSVRVNIHNAATGQKIYKYHRFS